MEGVWEGWEMGGISVIVWVLGELMIDGCLFTDCIEGGG